MSDTYAEVGRAERKAQAIEEAFRSILRADFNVAERALARAQVEHYGLKPWKKGIPTKTALEQGIVFEDQHGGRYTVHEVQENGSHVRYEMGDRRYVGQVTSFTVHAETLEEARLLASVFSNNRALPEVREEGLIHQNDGRRVIRFKFGRMPLD